MHETYIDVTYTFESVSRLLTFIIRNEKNERTRRRAQWTVTTSPSVRVSAGGAQWSNTLASGGWLLNS